MTGFFTKRENQKVINLSWDDNKKNVQKAITSKLIDEKRKQDEDDIKRLNQLENVENWVDPEEINQNWTNEIDKDVKLEEMKYNLNWKTLIFFDTETTWLDLTSDIIEISYHKVYNAWKTNNLIVESESQLFKTDQEISIWAKMKSWITEDMIQDCEYFKDSKMYEKFKELSENKNVIFVAHNIEFDRQMLKNVWIELDDTRTICTLKLIKILFPELETHALVWIKYCFPMILEASRRLWLKQEEHRAWYDTQMLYLTFNFIINYIINNEKFKTKNVNDIINRMIELTNSLIQMKYIPFWKYKWETFNNIYELDKQYLEWLYLNEKQKSIEERPNQDLIYTIEKVFSQYNNKKNETNIYQINK